MGERCFICGEDNPTVLQEHHAVPRRFEGRDTEENVYTLCANCHQAVEKMYDARFYERLPTFNRQRFVDERVPEPDPTMMEAVEVFIRVCTIRDDRSREPREDLRKAYREFARQNGYDTFSSKKEFGEVLTSNFDFVEGGNKVKSRNRDLNRAEEEYTSDRPYAYRGIRFTETGLDYLHEQ